MEQSEYEHLLLDSVAEAFDLSPEEKEWVRVTAGYDRLIRQAWEEERNAIWEHIKRHWAASEERLSLAVMEKDDDAD